MSHQVPLRPLVCDPTAVPAAARVAHAALTRRLFAGHAVETQEVEGGYAFGFPALVSSDLSRFLENERRCCPFLTLTLERRPVEAAVWLRITGPEGTQELLSSEFLALMRTNNVAD